MRTAYKIFEVYELEGCPVPRTLFHGLHGSRVLPVGKTLRAEKKLVTNGSQVRRYRSGFHAYYWLEDVKDWLRGSSSKRLKNRVVVKVLVGEIRNKPRAVRPTILADVLRIPRKCWEERLSAEDLLRRYQDETR